jgi:hypothetical protein
MNQKKRDTAVEKNKFRRFSDTFNWMRNYQKAVNTLETKNYFTLLAPH